MTEASLGPAVMAAMAAAASWYVAGPLWRRAETAPAAHDPGGEPGAEAERTRLAGERDAALRTLRDLALDHATGKMSDADYEDLRRRHEAHAVEILRRLDRVPGPPL